MTPYSPMAASTSARTVNVVSTSMTKRGAEIESDIWTSTLSSFGVTWPSSDRTSAWIGRARSAVPFVRIMIATTSLSAPGK